MKKPTKKSTRNKADALLTPIIKKLHPRCLLCGAPTQVAHHHVHKSKSTALRYVINNLINLCNKCHCALHVGDESYYASRIVEIKGIKWFQGLIKIKDTVIVKADIYFYQKNYERLSKILAKLLK